jgi:hypothetical protein
MTIGYSILDKCTAFTISILLLLSCYPVIFRGHFVLLIITATLIFLILFGFKLLRNDFHVSRKFLVVIFVLLILAMYIFIPFREYDRLSLTLVWFLVLVVMLLLDYNVLKIAFYYFSIIIFLISVLALLGLFLNAVGIYLPQYSFERDIGGYYTSQYISVRLSGQDYTIFGIDLYRINGIFGEPGHFGLLICMILYVYEKSLNTLKGTVLLITCLLTFSLGAYVLLSCLFVMRAILNKQYNHIIILLFFILTLVILIPNDLLIRFFLSKADDVLDSRTSDHFVLFYNIFLNSNHVLIGYGRDVLEIVNLRNSDYRGFVIRYGYIGVALFTMLFIAIFKKKDRNIQILGAIYVFVVFLHRSWFVDYFIFIFFLIVLSNSYMHKLSSSKMK